MAVHGKRASVLVNEFDLSRFLKSISPSLDVEMIESTAFQAPGDAREYTPGNTDGKLSAEGFYQSNNVTLKAIEDVFAAALGSDVQRILTVSPEGADAVGRRTLQMLTDLAKRSVTSPATGLIMSSAEFQSSTGVEPGAVLHPVTPETATGSAASVDNAAASAGGGVAHLHVTAKAGTTPSITVKVQHSVDNAVWVDLATFTAATAETAQRVEIAGTVNRYVRATWTITGTAGPSFTFAVAFARR